MSPTIWAVDITAMNQIIVAASATTELMRSHASSADGGKGAFPLSKLRGNLTGTSQYRMSKLHRARPTGLF